MLYLAMAIAMSVGRSVGITASYWKRKIERKKTKAKWRITKMCIYGIPHTENKSIECFALSCVAQIQILVFIDKCRQFWKKPPKRENIFHWFYMKRADSGSFFQHCALLSKHSKPKKRIWIWFFSIFHWFSPFICSKQPYQMENLSHTNINSMKWN